MVNDNAAAKRKNFLIEEEPVPQVVTTGHYSLRKMPINARPYDSDFPHEFQEFADGCGAAAFSMVYKSLGRPFLQKDIFKKVSVPDPNTGGLTCSSHLLLLDALVRGFDALHIRAINPIDMLKACQKHSIRAVTNERAEPLSIVGHMGVFLGMDDRHIYQHCSALGPRQIITHNQLLERMASFGYSDVGEGNAITLISNPLMAEHFCPVCGDKIPEEITCLHCKKRFLLRPAAPLGCFREECPNRAWLNIYCPFCFNGIRKTKDPKGASMTQEEWDKERQKRQKRQREVEERELFWKKLFSGIGKEKDQAS